MRSFKILGWIIYEGCSDYLEKSPPPVRHGVALSPPGDLPGSTGTGGVSQLGGCKHEVGSAARRCQNLGLLGQAVARINQILQQRHCQNLKHINKPPSQAAAKTPTILQQRHCQNLGH